MQIKKYIFRRGLQTSALTPFFVSATTNPNPCALIGADFPPYNVEYFHDGVMEYPEIGDTVYLDSGGVTLLPTLGYLQADLNILYIEDGIATIFSCR